MFCGFFRARRKSLLRSLRNEERLFVGGGGGVSTFFAKQASKQKKRAARRLRALLGLLQIDLSSIERRTLRKGAADKSIECFVRMATRGTKKSR